MIWHFLPDSNYVRILTIRKRVSIQELKAAFEREDEEVLWQRIGDRDSFL